MKNLDDIRNKWQREKEVPEVVRDKAASAFRQIRREVEEERTMGPEERNSAGETVRRIHPGRRLRYAAAVLAALVLGTGVFAAEYYHLTDWFPKVLGSKAAREQIVNDLEVTVSGQQHVPEAYAGQAREEEFWARAVIPEESSLLNLEEAQYDGQVLYIYGVPTENGKKYLLGADRIYINDMEWGPVLTDALHTHSQGEGYTFEVDLSGLTLTEKFTVTLPLSVYQEGTRFQNQELTFVMNAAAGVQKAENQSFLHDGYRIDVQEISRTTNAIRLSVCYRISPEKKAEWKAAGKIPVPWIQVGEELRFHETEEQDSEDGIECRFELTGLAAETDQVMLLTYLCTPESDVKDQEPVAKDTVDIRMISGASAQAEGKE